MKEKLKLSTNLPILILVSVFTCYLVVKDSILDVKGIIFSCNIFFLVLSFIMVMFGDFFKAFSVYVIAKKSETNLSLKDSYSLQLETNFFNGVTPFALGGQPFQLYLLKHKNKIPYLKGTNIIFCDYYAFQIDIPGYPAQMRTFSRCISALSAATISFALSLCGKTRFPLSTFVLSPRSSKNPTTAVGSIV